MSGKGAEQIARGGGGALLIIISARLVRFLTQVALSRLLGAADYGKFTLLMAITYLASAVAAFGLPTAIVRFGAAYRMAANSEMRALLVRNSLVLIHLLAGMIFLCLLFARDNLVSLLGISDIGTGVLVLASGSIFLINIGVWAAGLLQSQARAVPAAMLQELLPAVTRFALIVSAVAFGAGVSGAVLGHVAGVALVAVIAAILLRQYFASPRPAAPESRRQGLARIRPTIPTLLRISAPMMLSGLTYTILLYADRFMIAHYIRDTAIVGIYNAAATIALQMAVAMMAGNMVFAPLITAAHERGDRLEMEQLLHRTTWWVTLLAVPVAVVIALNAPYVMGLFGDEFSNGATALMLLSAAQLYNMATGPVGILLQMAGRQKLDLAINAFLVLTNIASNMLLIPRYGYIGAAMATLISMLFVHSGRLLAVRVLYGIWPFTGRQLVVGGGGFFVIMVGVILNPLPLWQGIMSSVFVLAAGFIIISSFMSDEEDRKIMQLMMSRISRFR